MWKFRAFRIINQHFTQFMYRNGCTSKSKLMLFPFPFLCSFHSFSWFQFQLIVTLYNNAYELQLHGNLFVINRIRCRKTFTFAIFRCFTERTYSVWDVMDTLFIYMAKGCPKLMHQCILESNLPARRNKWFGILKVFVSYRRFFYLYPSQKKMIAMVLFLSNECSMLQYI